MVLAGCFDSLITPNPRRSFLIYKTQVNKTYTYISRSIRLFTVQFLYGCLYFCFFWRERFLKDVRGVLSLRVLAGPLPVRLPATRTSTLRDKTQPSAELARPHAHLRSLTCPPRAGPPGAILLATVTGPRARVYSPSNFRRELTRELNTRSLLPPRTEEKRGENAAPPNTNPNTAFHSPPPEPWETIWQQIACLVFPRACANFLFPPRKRMLSAAQTVRRVFVPTCFYHPLCVYATKKKKERVKALTCFYVWVIPALGAILSPPVKF